MSMYSIEITQKVMKVHEGKVIKRAQLHYQGGGCNVYVKGNVGKRRDALVHLAAACFQREGIPLMQMRDVRVKT